MMEEKYPVVFAEDVFSEESNALSELIDGLSNGEKPRILLVADVNVVQRTEGLGKKIGHYLQRHGIAMAASPIVVAGGEKSKSDGMQSAVQIASSAVESRIGRNDLVLVLGGGAVLDVACWALSQVRGGMRVVRMPTTVSSMIGAAHSGFASLNIRGVKDSMRVAAEPAAVVIDTRFATTVLDGVWRAGFAEALRLAEVCDGAAAGRLSELAEMFCARDFGAMNEIVRMMVDVRRRSGSTPFAMWSASRLESMSDFKLPHGYAVAIGVAIDTIYAQLRGYITEDERDRVCAALESCGAMDCLDHSRKYISDVQRLLLGLDAWRLSTGREAIVLPKGLGGSILEEKPDRETMKAALNMLK